MLLGINSYQHKNSILHTFHPLLKFLIFLPIIFLLFLKITISTQFFIIFFLGILVSVSHIPTSQIKKLIYIYFGLVFFFFLVGWVFQKSPGFWTNKTLSEYHDIFGYKHEFDHAQDTKLEDNHYLSDDVNNGWYAFGRILTDKEKNKTKLFDSIDCLKQAAGRTINGVSKCTDAEHKHGNGEGNEYSKLFLNILKIPHNGSTRYIGFFPTWYTITELQIVSSFYFANRIFLLTILSLLLMSTSSLFSISYAFEDFFRPLKVLRLPSKEMALIIFITFRFVFSLISEAFRIIKAQASRGIDYKNGKLKDKISSLASLFVPLFFISFLKAEELSSSMKVRGYKPYETRSSFKKYTIVPYELLIFFVSTFFITLLYYFFFNNYHIHSLGNLEHLNKLV